MLREIVSVRCFEYESDHRKPHNFPRLAPVSAAMSNMTAIVGSDLSATTRMR